MPSRRRSRQRALQILFLWDARRQPVDEAIDAYYDSLYWEEPPERDVFVRSLVTGTVEHLAEVDEQIAKHAEHWRMERIDPLLASGGLDVLRVPDFRAFEDIAWGKGVDADAVAFQFQRPASHQV